MQTQITAELLATPAGREADAILRACVHCGFCTATCPTYQLLGDELDGPRGRIYQIKRVLEGHRPTRITQLHLDRCLSCRACETTCPSGVRYARLADIGRELIDEQVRRPWRERLLRRTLIAVVPHRTRLRPLMALARLIAPLLPQTLRAKVPRSRPTGAWPRPLGQRRMLAMQGCIQAEATPQTNVAAARVLARLGIDLIQVPAAGCCGALAYHLGDHAAARTAIRRNIDAWWPEITAGAEAILVGASGCGAFVREYGEILREDASYAAKAERIAALARDPSEVLGAEDLTPLGRPGQGRRIAFHAPCSLQHGLRLPQRVEQILTNLGFRLTHVPDSHLCCGSAGTYSITQPALATQLRANKLAALLIEDPELIATANIGCQLHLGAATQAPVVYWLELLEKDQSHLSNR